MTQNFRSLAELEAEMSKLQAQVAQAVQRGQTATEGSDPSGTFTVLVGPDGAARDVRIAVDWHSRIRPEQVGEAVVAADSDAAQRRARATAEAFASIQDAGTDLPAVTPVVPAAGPRPRTDIADRAWAALDDIHRFTAPPPPVTGADADGAVRLSLTQGRITGCDIDVLWLHRQDDTTLAHALRQALISALAAQTEANQPAVEFTQRLSDLLADVKATLGDVHRGI
jgi:hypothetical protein